MGCNRFLVKKQAQFALLRHFRQIIILFVYVQFVIGGLKGAKLSSVFYKKHVIFTRLINELQKRIKNGNSDLIIGTLKQFCTELSGIYLFVEKEGGLSYAQKAGFEKLAVEAEVIKDYINNIEKLSISSNTVNSAGAVEIPDSQHDESPNEVFNKLKARYDLLKEDLGKLKINQDKETKKLTGFKESLGSLEDEVKNKLDATQTLYDNSEKELNLKKDEIDNLLGVISSNVTSDAYSKNAEIEKKDADMFRWFSIGLMGGSIAFILHITSQLNITYDSIFWVRLSVAFVFIFPSIYLARESSKHRKQQYLYNQTALSLSVLTPLIASLTEEQQNDIKKEIAMKLFSEKEFEDVTKDSMPVDLDKLLKELTGIIQKMVKK